MLRRSYLSEYATLYRVLFFLFFFLNSSLWAQGIWLKKTDMPTARHSARACIVAGKIYVFGGDSTDTGCGSFGLKTVEVYDPAEDSWSAKAIMPRARSSMAVSAANGKIYVMGGDSVQCSIARASVDEYYPQTNSWNSNKSPMSVARSGLSSSVINGKIYAIGGVNFNSGEVLKDVEEYDPVADSWTQKAPMHVARAWFSTCVVDGKIYAFGGGDSGGKSVEMYDPVSNTWTLRSDMPEARGNSFVETVNGLIYIFGGTLINGGPPYSNIWEYNPHLDNWKLLDQMPLALSAGASNEVNGKIYLIGGTTTAWPFVPVSTVFEFTPPKTINVPGDQLTIQAAIDSSNDGDVVLVDEGTYYENINFKGKKITVASHYYLDGDTAHISNTIINGSQPSNPDSGSVVYFFNGEDTTSVLTGFTITGGTGTSFRVFPDWWQSKSGAGIFVLWSGAKIQNNKIINNNISVSSDTVTNGTAIVAFGESGDYLIIRDNLISENSASSSSYVLGTVQWGMKEKTVFERNVVTNNLCTAPNVYGGGLLLYGQAGWQGLYVVRDNIIKNNILDGSSDGRGGGIHIGNCAPEIINNIISGNEAPNGAGIAVNQWDTSIEVQKPLFINNTIFNNSALASGGGIYIDGSQQPEVKAINNIIWGNKASSNLQIGIASGSITLRYSDVEGGWTGEGNIDADPLLVADSLADGSPCIATGISLYDFGQGIVLQSPVYDIKGRMRPFPFGSNPDMGARESITGEDGYSLVWSDDFDGTELDLTKWEHMIGNGSNGWGNNELEYYRSENTTVDNGLLVITAKQESFGGRNYTSSRMRTLNKGDWKYGKFEIRAKMPVGQGLWPAIWMMPSDNVYGGWAASGEIDIMEYLGHDENRVYGTIHYGGSWPNNESTGSSYILDSGSYHKDFHLFSLIWEEEKLIWLVDGQPYQTQTNWWSSGGDYPAPFDQEFHMILNLAVGGNWPGNPDETTEFPQELIIDYVRVYQKKDTIEVSSKISGNYPGDFFLYQNYPNPFNPKTNIKYRIPKSDNVELSIYNILGQKVATLVNKKQAAGSHKVQWDASVFSSGIYIYRLETGNYSKMKKMILIR